MRRWFLSYHSPDQALAERLKAALERKDTDAQVFFAPSSLRAGGFWSKALAEEIAQADAFILLVGEKGVGHWQELEYDEALEKWVKFADFPIILVLLEGQTAPGLPFLRRLHWIITPDPSSEKDVARLFDAAAGRACGREYLCSAICATQSKALNEAIDALVETFLDTWQLGAIEQQNGWIELLRDGKVWRVNAHGTDDSDMGLRVARQHHRPCWRTGLRQCQFHVADL
jgi:TIR domain